MLKEAYIFFVSPKDGSIATEFVSNKSIVENRNYFNLEGLDKEHIESAYKSYVKKILEKIEIEAIPKPLFRGHDMVLK